MGDIVENWPVVCAKQDVGAALQEVDDERQDAENDVDAGVVDEDRGAPERVTGCQYYRSYQILI